MGTRPAFSPWKFNIDKAAERLLRKEKWSRPDPEELPTGLMFWTRDIHATAPAGRTEEIVPLIRKTFGDEMTLYADSNGYYSVEEAIRVGHLLHEHDFWLF